MRHTSILLLIAGFILVPGGIFAQFRPEGSKAAENTPLIFSLTHKAQSGVYGVAVSPNAKYIVTRDSGKNVHLWDAATGKYLRALHGNENSVRAFTFAGDSSVLIGASPEEATFLWEIPSGKLLLTIAGGSKVLHFAKSDNQVASVVQGEIHFYDAATGRSVGQVKGPTYPLTFSPDGSKLAAIPHFGQLAIRLFDGKSGQRLQDLEDCTCHPEAIAFSPDARVLAAGGKDQAIKVWDIPTRTLLYSLEGSAGTIQAITFSPDGRLMATGGFDKIVRIWDIVSGQQLAVLRGHEKVVAGLAFSADGRRLVSGGLDGAALVWDVSRVLSRAGAALADMDDTQRAWLWQALGSSDAAEAYSGIGGLLNSPPEAVPFLREKLAGRLHGQGKQIDQLIAELDHDSYFIREQATAQLKRLRAAAEAVLQATLEQSPSAEVQRRIRIILAAPVDHRESIAETRRNLRAIQVLEMLRTEPARKFLAEIAREFSSREVANEARASLARLQRTGG